MKIEQSVSLQHALHELPDEQLSMLYHENSKLFPQLAREQTSEFAASPFELYITSRGFRQFRQAKRIALPEELPTTESIQALMVRRRTRRDLKGAMSLEELATILRQALGATALVQNEELGVVQVLRAWPSAGALYPLDTYIVSSQVNGISPGLYHFNVITCELECLPSRPVKQILQDGFFWQDFITSAAAVLIFVAVFQRTMAKYGERGYRYIFLDAGHAAQNVLLAAEQLNLSAVPIGGFCDDDLAADLNIDGIDELVVYAIAMGQASEQPVLEQGL